MEKLIKDAPNDPIKRAKPEPDAAGVAAAPAVSADTIDPAAIDWPEPFYNCELDDPDNFYSSNFDNRTPMNVGGIIGNG